MLDVEDHPLLALHAFTATLPARLAECPVTPAIAARLAPDTVPTHAGDAQLQKAVRDLLRHGGFSPSGRSKPSCEYLARAVATGALPSINLAVDACNAVSLHMALPISVVDLDRATAPLRVAVAPKGARYVFNAAGQEIDVGGLVMLHDADGPCAGPVKDSHRTKTHADTTRLLAVVWTPRAYAAHGNAARRAYEDLLREAGATVTTVADGR